MEFQLLSMRTGVQLMYILLDSNPGNPDGNKDQTEGNLGSKHQIAPYRVLDLPYIIRTIMDIYLTQHISRLPILLNHVHAKK